MLLSPPTTSPTNSAMEVDFFYPVYEVEWDKSGCSNKLPLPFENLNDRPTYASHLACCKVSSWTCICIRVSFSCINFLLTNFRGKMRYTSFGLYFIRVHMQVKWVVCASASLKMPRRHHLPWPEEKLIFTMPTMKLHGIKPPAWTRYPYLSLTGAVLRIPQKRRVALALMAARCQGYAFALWITHRAAALHPLPLPLR